MPEWLKIGDIASTNPDSLTAKTDFDYTFRYIDLSAIEKGYIDWNACRQMRFGEAPSRARRRVRKGDVLFGTVRPNLQSHCYIGESATDLVASTGFCVVRSHKGNSSGKYLFHALFSNEVYRQSVNAAVGSNYPALTDEDVRNFDVFLPSLPQQEIVAGILDSLDAQIRRTEEVIAKLDQVKEGLLTDLLTRGVDENGELRPPPEKAPELYKESALGSVPKAWEVTPVANIGEIVTGATPPASDALAWGADLPFVTPADIGLTDHVSCAERMVSKRGLQYLRPLPTGSTLVVCIGATIGKVGFATAPVATNQQVNAVIPSEKYNSKFIFLAIYGHVRQILAWAGLQAVPIVNKSTFGHMLIPIPQPKEQAMIAEYAKAVEERLVTENGVISKLRAQRDGLRNDLLTGRVRVTPLLEEHAQAAG